MSTIAELERQHDEILNEIKVLERTKIVMKNDIDKAIGKLRVKAGELLHSRTELELAEAKIEDDARKEQTYILAKKSEEDTAERRRTRQPHVSETERKRLFDDERKARLAKDHDAGPLVLGGGNTNRRTKSRQFRKKSRSLKKK